MVSLFNVVHQTFVMPRTVLLCQVRI